MLDFCYLQCCTTLRHSAHCLSLFQKVNKVIQIKLFKSSLSSATSHNGILILCSIHTNSWGKTYVLGGFLKHLFSTSSKSTLEIVRFLLGSIFSFGQSFLIPN